LKGRTRKNKDRTRKVYKPDEIPHQNLRSSREIMERDDAEL